MNQQVARLYPSSHDQARGEMVLDQIQNYSDLWGFKNFAMSRLLTKEEVLQTTGLQVSEEAPLYLELIHHPSLKGAKIERDIYGRVRPSLAVSSSLIPLKEEHLKTIMEHLYTARFVVEKGVVRSYGLGKNQASRFLPYLPHLKDVADGSYEFYHGKAYKVSWEGITSELPSNHPLYQATPERVQLFYNLGIQFDTRFSPKSSVLLPSRYAYFRDGDLYLLGAPFLKKTDPALAQFVRKEKQKAVPFEDYGPPSSEEIRKYGLKIPDKQYLVLGDNHAMSADSRHFGFVPEDNLRGVPSLLFWPPGARFGIPPQPSYSWFTFPNLSVWSAAFVSFAIWYALQRRRDQAIRQQPLEET
jgi:signal peptidase I